MQSNNVFASALVGKGLKKKTMDQLLLKSCRWEMRSGKTLFLKKLVISLKIYACCSLMFYRH